MPIPSLPSVSLPVSTPLSQTQSLPSTPRLNSFQAKPSRLGTTRTTTQNTGPPPHTPDQVNNFHAVPKPLAAPPASGTSRSGFPSLGLQGNGQAAAKPNYNISFEPPASSRIDSVSPSLGTLPMAMGIQGHSSITQPVIAPPIPSTMGTLLTPSKPAQMQKPSQSNIDWGDFDPLA
jgi:hypothetical protein